MLMLQGIHDWPLFVVAGLLLNVTPGADMALVASRGAAQGFRSGAAAALGVGAGCWVHTAAAALGLSALLAGSAATYTLLRWAGAAYLVWLGVSMWRRRPPADGAAALPGATAWQRVFAQGFLTNALNPKVALFFLAFVPQFIAADAPHKALAFVALGTVFVVNGTLVNLGVAWIAASLGRRVAERPGARRAALWLQRGVGVVFVGLGLRLAVAD